MDWGVDGVGWVAGIHSTSLGASVGILFLNRLDSYRQNGVETVGVGARYHRPQVQYLVA